EQDRDREPHELGPSRHDLFDLRADAVGDVDEIGELGRARGACGHRSSIRLAASLSGATPTVEVVGDLTSGQSTPSGTRGVAIPPTSLHHFDLRIRKATG